MELFTAPAPDGMGFNKLMYRGHFKNEIAKLVQWYCLCDMRDTDGGVLQVGEAVHVRS